MVENRPPSVENPGPGVDKSPVFPPLAASTSQAGGYRSEEQGGRAGRSTSNPPAFPPPYSVCPPRTRPFGARCSGFPTRPPAYVSYVSTFLKEGPDPCVL